MRGTPTRQQTPSARARCASAACTMQRTDPPICPGVRPRKETARGGPPAAERAVWRAREPCARARGGSRGGGGGAAVRSSGRPREGGGRPAMPAGPTPAAPRRRWPRICRSVGRNRASGAPAQRARGVVSTSGGATCGVPWAREGFGAAHRCWRCGSRKPRAPREPQDATVACTAAARRRADGPESTESSASIASIKTSTPLKTLIFTFVSPCAREYRSFRAGMQRAGRRRSGRALGLIYARLPLARIWDRRTHRWKRAMATAVLLSRIYSRTRIGRRY